MACHSRAPSPRSWVNFIGSDAAVYTSISATERQSVSPKKSFSAPPPFQGRLKNSSKNDGSKMSRNLRTCLLHVFCT